jgi:hypothetical protein
MSGARSSTPERRAASLDLRPLDLLERMTPEERLRAYRAGVMTRADRAAWAAVWPEEVPRLNDEFEWLVVDCE